MPLLPLPCQLAFAGLSPAEAAAQRIPMPATPAPAQLSPKVSVKMNPAREIFSVSPAIRPNTIPLHIFISDDLRSITYAYVDDDRDVFSSPSGKPDYSAIRERKFLTIPSLGLVTPQRYIDSQLEHCLGRKLSAMLSQSRRYTTYRGTTTSWDISVDRDVWTTNIDTAFLCKILSGMGVFDDRSYRKVLEIGVGGGHTSAALASSLPAIQEISMTDISIYALQTAKLSLSAYLGTGVRDRYFHGAGIKNVDDDYDLIVVNPPYIPVPPSMTESGDPYRGTGLIREIVEIGTGKLNRKNPNARILINVSSLAWRDFEQYIGEAGGSIRLAKAGPSIRVPLKINSIDESWRRWLCEQGLLQYRPELPDYQEKFWHAIRMFQIGRPASENVAIAAAPTVFVPPQTTATAPARDHENEDSEQAEHYANYRKLYERKFKGMDLPERLETAAKANGNELAAICLDPNPQVITRAIENGASDIMCARIIASHATASLSLLALGKKPTFLFDPGVRRNLLRNPITPPYLRRRILEMMDMQTLYTVRSGSDVNEQSKMEAVEVMRQKFRSASGADCANFIFRTEGRCLAYLIKESFSKETVEELCSREFRSEILVRNLTVFPALPPNLIRHLMRQDIVKRNPNFRNRLLHHQSCPADVKQKNR